MAKKIINAFNAGEVTPNVHARTDNELYDSACLKMENFLPLEYGGATRRPATKFLAELNLKSVIHPFIFNVSTTYNLVFSNTKIDVYIDGNKQATIITEYLESELYELKFYQSLDTLFIAHKNHPVSTLIRYSDTDWSFSTLEYKMPPLLDLDDDLNFSITGSTKAGESINITATSDIFYSTHVGSDFLILQERDNTNSILAENVEKNTDDDNSDNDPSFISSSINVSFSNWEFQTQGAWRGKVVILRSLDGGNSYEEYVDIADTTHVKRHGTDLDLDSFSNKNFSFASSEKEGINTFLKVQFNTPAHTSTYHSYDNFSFTLKANDPYIYSLCNITSVGSDATETVGVNTATATLKSDLIETVDSYTTTWDNNTAFARNDKVVFRGSFRGTPNELESRTITSSGTTATVTHTSHGFSAGDVIVVAESSDPVYNGTYKVASTTTDSYTYIMPSNPAVTNPTGTKAGKLKAFQLQDAGLTDLSNVVDATSANINGTETLFVLLDNKTIHKYTVSNSGQTDVTYTHAGNFTLSGSVVARTKGLAFYDNHLYTLGVDDFESGSGTSDSDHWAQDAYIRKYDLSGQFVSTLFSFPLRTSVDSYGTGHVYGLGYASGHFYANIQWHIEANAKISNVTRQYKTVKINTSGQNVAEYIHGQFNPTQTLSSLQNEFDAFSYRYMDFIEVEGSVYTLNDHDNQIDKRNVNLDHQNFSLPLPNVSRWRGVGYDKTNSNLYCIDSTGKIYEFAFTGDTKYYQCQTSHTSSTDFNTDISNWSRRYPNQSKFQESAFNNYRGFPQAVAIFENRLCLGGSKNNPNTLDLSKIDDLNNFATGSFDTDSIRLSINSGTFDEIKWLCSSRELVIGTVNNEWSLGSGNQNLPVTPTQLNLKRRSQYGSSQVQGLLVNSAVLFFMRQSKKLREWYLQENQEDYLASDLAYIAEHITGGGIVQMAVQTQPTTIIWMVRNDGVLVGLTYERETKTFAWHRHTFEGDVESVSVLPTASDEDKVFLSIKRPNANERDIVQLDKQNWGTDYTTEYSGLDLYVKYTGDDKTSLTGLDHLEGKTVTVIDGGTKLSSTYTVTSGTITIDSTDNTVYVGLPYTSTLAPLYLDANGSMGSKKSVPHAVIRFKDTLKAKVGQKESGVYGENDASVLEEVRFSPRDVGLGVYPTPSTLKTNDFEVYLANHNEFLQTIYIIQDEPSPCTVLAMVADVEGV